MRPKTLLSAVLILALNCAVTLAQPAAAPAQRWSVRMADSVIARSPKGIHIEGGTVAKWSYSPAFCVYAVGEVGLATGETKYTDYVRDYMNAFLDEGGALVTATYVMNTYKLDDIAPGRCLLLLNRQTKDARWLKACATLAEQLKTQPHTADGGYWHKQTYPHQMWLDGIFMDCPFMTEYGKVSNQPKWIDEAANQIITIAKHSHDPKTGLYYHGWDESKAEQWANKETGTSKCFWGRAVGWYVMGIVETLENLPADHPNRAKIVSILSDLADAIGKVQDPKTGVWYQVLDKPDGAGNYLESSGSCMFVFALAKGVRLGVLDARHLAVAKKGHEGILKQFIEEDAKTGQISLKDTCKVAGLGGRPYRDGSFEYYMREPRISNDPKGVAPFILGSLEIERLAK